MRINKKIIKNLNPCKDRFDNFIANYSDYDSNLENFILLDKISYNDKIWVFIRLATKEQTVKWALLCAFKVLPVFEDKYPNDKRPRQALEAVEAWLKNPNDTTANAAANAANAAAYAAYAASYAANAAAYAAYAASYAAYAASAAANAAANADHAAANAAAYAVYAGNIKEEVNLMFMVEAIKCT
jgi:hypothetical protein